jgi:hypothetical protein
MSLRWRFAITLALVVANQTDGQADTCGRRGNFEKNHGAQTT